MARQTLGPAPGLRRSDPRDPQPTPQFPDPSEFVDPDNDEDCRAGLLELDRLDDEDNDDA